MQRSYIHCTMYRCKWMHPNTVPGRNNLLFFFTEEEFKKYYRMPGWGKPLYEMKEAKIPEGAIPNAFDWRDKGALSCLKLSCWTLQRPFFSYLQRTVGSLCIVFLVKLVVFFSFINKGKWNWLRKSFILFLTHIVVLK